MFCLMEIYSCISKAQHGVSKVNQLPWQFFDRVDHLIAELDVIAAYRLTSPGESTLSKNLDLLKKGEIKGVANWQ